MATKLYVGNLSYQTKDDTLSALFAQVGTVTSCQVMTDRYTGESRGFAFVEMATEAEAQSAISSLDGKSFEGRNLKVNESKPREGGSGGGGNRGGGGGYGGGSRGGDRGGYGGGNRW